MQSISGKLALKTSLDWPEIKDELKRMSKMLPAFSTDFYKIMIHLDKLHKDLGNLEIEVRCRKSVSATIACDAIVKQINDELKLIQKIHLMSILSR